MSSVIIEWFVGLLEGFNLWLKGLIDLIIQWIQALGPIGVFIGVMIETFIAPIPSPIIPMGAGFLLTLGYPLPVQMLIIIIDVMLVGAFAATVGSFFGYGIAYLGGYPIIERYGKYLGTSIEEVEYMRKRFDQSSRDEIYLFVARAIPIIPLSVVSIVAGAIRMDTKRFALVTFLGSLPRYLILGLAGWVVGFAFEAWAEIVDFIETLTLVLVVLFIIVFIVFRIIIRRQSKAEKRAASETENK